MEGGEEVEGTREEGRVEGEVGGGGTREEGRSHQQWESALTTHLVWLVPQTNPRIKLELV